ncbi:hypothetical protein PBRA_003202 [Plasmodiophora brassicae]|uniref:Uncharacterized protein n=1 Tax=Plasmodiophora brassicae TaxID=37360 RepID=A0A0G4J7E0_PLABS|nr:hypothetical protein PBRA_003202 [Plasmodiophora brassicae]
MEAALRAAQFHVHCSKTCALGVVAMEGGPVDDIPREALRGLPNSAVRLISNLCREVFEVNRRMETVEQNSQDASSNSRDIWNTIETTVHTFRTSVENQIGTLSVQMNALAEENVRLKNELQKQSRDATQRSVTSLESLVKNLSAGFELRELSTTSMLKEHITSMKKRQDGCWETIHFQQQRILELERQISEFMTTEEKAMETLRQEFSAFQVDKLSEFAKLFRLAEAAKQANQKLSARLDQMASDCSKNKDEALQKMVSYTEECIAHEKNHRASEITMLLEATERLETQAASMSSKRERDSSGSEDQAAMLMATVNTNTAIFTEKYGDVLSQVDDIRRHTKIVGENMKKLEDRVQSSLNALYETVTSDVQRQMRKAMALGSASTLQIRPGEPGNTASVFTIQAQLDRLQDQRANDMRGLRKSMESICDAMAQLSRDLEDRILRFESDSKISSVKSRVRVASLDLGPDGQRIDRPLTPARSAPATKPRGFLTSRPLSRVARPPGSRSSQQGCADADQAALTTQGVAVMSSATTTPRPGAGRQVLTIHAPLDIPGSARSSTTDHSVVNRKREPVNTSMPLLPARIRKQLELFALEHSSVPKYVFDDAPETSDSQRLTSMIKRVRRQRPQSLPEKATSPSRKQGAAPNPPIPHRDPPDQDNAHEQDTDLDKWQ